jgi:adenosylcobinamide-GDP ribazoletransferase
MWVDFWTAVTFLTTLPAPVRLPSTPDLGRAARWFSLVGLLIGLALWGVQALAGWLFAPWLAGGLVVVAWAALTGALHLDGLADCCDGLLAPVAPERRLEILRDPRLGSFGVAGLVLFLVLKVGAVAAVGPAAVGPAALLLAPAWARWLLLIAAQRPQARPDGMGAAFAATLTPRTLGIAAIVPVAVVALSGAPLTALLALVVATGAALGAARLAEARLGGVTGDVYGLVVELAELAVLLVFAAQLAAV